MIARNIALVVAGFLLVTACAASQVVARQEALLNVGQGQIPNDTGSDGATTMTIEECKELGGKALKVVFAKGDSFGDRKPGSRTGSNSSASSSTPSIRRSRKCHWSSRSSTNARRPTRPVSISPLR
ncbi:MAG: hypothetical protein ACLP9L_21395 [Thermoguttaceae bacterium]